MLILMTIRTISSYMMHHSFLGAGGAPCCAECALFILSPLPFKRSESDTACKALYKILTAGSDQPKGEETCTLHFPQKMLLYSAYLMLIHLRPSQEQWVNSNGPRS